MSGTRAEWHLADLAEQDEDPFGMMLYTTGIDIDLTSSEDELVAAMQSLWRREQNLSVMGLTCEFKDAGQDCRTCPHATLDPEEHRSALCRVGKDESTIDARYEELHGARAAQVTELAARVDEATEIGTLPPELEELLTQVAV